MSRTARARRTAARAADDRPRRVAIYIRRSTDEEHQPFSLEAQETKLRAFVSSQPGQWHIVATYTDDASGATTDRPGLTRALQEAKLGRFDTLLVYRVDRFSRRLRDMVTLLDELDDVQVTFRSATEPFDTATPVGRMVIQLLGVFAEFEREVIIDRVINGMERKAAKGKWLGGPRPYGYHHDPQTDALTPDQTEAAVITRVFDLYTRRRLGTRAIANQLNQQGLRTRRGKPWSGRTIQLMLTNRGYLGETSFRDITVPNAHDAIIQPDVFDLAQRILTERGETIGRRAANPSDYDLTGLIVCPQCGRKYIGTNATGRTRTYRYYTCFSRQRYGTNAGCNAHRFNADTLDTAIREALIDFYTTGDHLIAQAVAEFQQAHQDSHADLRRELTGVEKERANTQAAIDRYLTAFEAGTMDPDVCQPRLAELAERAKQLRTRHAELTADLHHPPAAPSPAELRQVREHIRDIFAHGTAQERKSLYKALIDHIEITSDNTIVPVYRVPMTGNPDGPDRPEPAVSGANDPVRALVSMVGGTGIEPVTSSASRSCSASPTALGDGAELRGWSVVVHRWSRMYVLVVTQLGTHRCCPSDLLRVGPRLGQSIMGAVAKSVRAGCRQPYARASITARMCLEEDGWAVDFGFVKLAAAVASWRALAFVEWVGLAGAAVSLIGFPLALVGLWLTWRQAKNAVGAAEAAKTAIGESKRQIGSSQLLVLIPQLRSIAGEISLAVEEGNRGLALRQLEYWRSQAAKIKGVLVGTDPTQTATTQIISEGIVRASVACRQIERNPQSLDGSSTKARESILEVCDRLDEWMGGRVMQVTVGRLE